MPEPKSVPSIWLPIRSWLSTDRILGLVSIALGIVTWVLAERLPTVATFRDVGPAFFPKIIAWGFIATGLGLIAFPNLRAFQSDPDAAPDQEDAGDDRPMASRIGRFALLLFLSAAYIMVLPLLGFIWSTISFVFLLSILFGSRNYGLNLVVSVTATAALYLVFRVWLRVPLPG